jgi:hypothetical protein
MLRAWIIRSAERGASRGRHGFAAVKFDHPDRSDRWGCALGPCRQIVARDENDRLADVMGSKLRGSGGVRLSHRPANGRLGPLSLPFARLSARVSGALSNQRPTR